ncbi:hypothetical protein SARC_07491 [Sphaeroforma arctica JP610]|uniref:Antistasin-like domain-containing protein n=1 Tax=Sphaeroforma arctica JP610 TaxID=667725 RepID=A0A0L0FU11_9EUKA|nr:hypothetical protein SARC_07491 [Sphaeroforma arctica JP610]KNC80139.1 hypothetical protein SARC_07491 [Sphaeroforma arctica JP610]|eukprot:XP_014154041.1 hypothetical protein SARC_07491 [Sphaeroforma arctica JP610]
MNCVAFIVAAFACLQLADAMSSRAYESDIYEPLASDKCPEDCKTFFDGCNQCMCLENGDMACTKMVCSEEEMEDAMCIDDLELYPVPAESETFECSGIMCMMYCKEGFKKDENGCDLCECAEPVEPVDVCAEMPLCMKYCENGNVVDENGCDTCECKEAPQFCAEGCEFYFDGCNTCTCGGDGVAACTEVFCESYEEAICLDAGEPECGPVCTVFCEYGNVMDEDNCPTCVCKEAP